MVDLVRLKDAYWEVVADSLVAFHGYSPMAAQARVLDFRERIGEGDLGTEPPDIIYHAEPFHLAGDLAGGRIGLGGYRQEYAEIMEKRFGAAGHAVDQASSAAYA